MIEELRNEIGIDTKPLEGLLEKRPKKGIKKVTLYPPERKSSSIILTLQK